MNAEYKTLLRESETLWDILLEDVNTEFWQNLEFFECSSLFAVQVCESSLVDAACCLVLYLYTVTSCPDFFKCVLASSLLLLLSLPVISIDTCWSSVSLL